MKTLKWVITIFILAVVMCLQVRGQETDVLNLAEKMPEYPGGVEALKEFISTNIKYPAEAKTEGIQGKVFVSFTVDKAGKVTDAEIAKGVHSALDAEALRVIKKMPNWKPGENEGVPVDVRYTVPVAFRLSEESTD